MCKRDQHMTEEEKLLREKARQALKKNKTPGYSPDDEGGLSSGPIDKDEMRKQAEEDDKSEK